MSAPSDRVGVAACVLNWNNLPATIRCIDALAALPELEEGSVSLQVLVIDNGSEAACVVGLRDRLAPLAERGFRLIESPQNLGYAGGNNLGIRYALGQLDAAFIWILNNDTLPAADSLTALLRCADADPSVAIWGSTLIDPDGLRLQCAGGCRYNPWLTTYRPALAGRPLSVLDGLGADGALDYISGAAMLIRSDLLREVGLLDERLFLYFEELDLARRLPDGRSIGWCRGSRVRHIGGDSTEGRRAPPGFSVYHASYSVLLFTRTHYPGRLWFAAPFRLLAKGLQLTLRRDGAGLRALLWAYLDFFSGHGQRDRFAVSR